MHSIVSLKHAVALFSATVLTQVLAVPLETRQDVGIASINLNFGSDCTRHDDIIKAWDDAITLLNNVGTIDFNQPAAIEFFGPPQLNKAYQSKVQAVFNNAKTFGEGWKITPAPWKVQVNVGCGKQTDRELDSRCKNKGVGLKAYTWNTKNTDGTGPDDYHNKDAQINMYYCNSFFAYKDLDARIDEYKDSTDYKEKYNMAYYTNRAYIVVHEMMHADKVAFSGNGDRHIFDMRMAVWDYEKDKYNNPNDDKYKRKLVHIDAYGAVNTKILARTSKANIATDITTNADNFAQYALAKYVQGKVGGYPWLPIADKEAAGQIRPKSLIFDDGSNGWGVSSNYEPSLTVGDDLTVTVEPETDTNGLSAEDGPVPLADLNWIGDDQYPADYISSLNEWAAKDAPAPTATPTPTPAPSGPTVEQKCAGLGSKKYLAQPTLAGNIKDFCSQAVKQGVQDKDSGSLGRNFNPKTLDEVNIVVDWPSGDKIPFDEAECNNRLKALSDDCDGNDPANPMNYKGGGTVSVDKALYHIVPAAPRQALPNTPGGSCDVRYKFIYDEFWIWGNGYASSDYGQGNGGLLQQIKGCDGLTDWSFDYGLGSDGREWSAHGHLLIGKAGCVGRAIQSAGGPKNVDCSGDT